MTTVIVVLGVVAAIAWTVALWPVLSETRWGIRVFVRWSNWRGRRNY